MADWGRISPELLFFPVIYSWKAKFIRPNEPTTRPNKFDRRAPAGFALTSGTRHFLSPFQGFLFLGMNLVPRASLRSALGYIVLPLQGFKKTASGSRGVPDISPRFPR